MLTSCEGSKQVAEGQQLSDDGVSKRDRMIAEERVTSTTTNAQDTFSLPPNIYCFPSCPDNAIDTICLDVNNLILDDLNMDLCNRFLENLDYLLPTLQCIAEDAHDDTLVQQFLLDFTDKVFKYMRTNDFDEYDCKCYGEYVAHVLNPIKATFMEETYLEIIEDNIFLDHDNQLKCSAASGTINSMIEDYKPKTNFYYDFSSKQVAIQNDTYMKCSHTDEKCRTHMFTEHEIRIRSLFFDYIKDKTYDPPHPSERTYKK